MSTQLTEAQKALADGLAEIGAVKFGAFRLRLHESDPSAPLSPIYLDLRLLRSAPDVMDLATDELRRLAERLQFDRLADIPIGSSPIVAILAFKMRKPLVTPRPTKTHGTGDSISGAFQPGETILLVDDLVSRSDSKLEAIRILEDNGLRVSDVLVLVDREQGGGQHLQTLGYELHAVLKLSDLLAYYLETGRLDEQKHREVMDYLGA